MRILPGIILALALVSSCHQKEQVNHQHEVKIENRIFDNANVLTIEEEETIFHSMKELEEEIGSQIAIFTIDTIARENIEQFSLRTANTLGIGRKDFDDGILITVAIKNRQMRIEVGYGLEKIIKDEIASRINREDMAPKFKEGDFTGGLTAAVEKIKKLIEENKDLVGQRP